MAGSVYVAGTALIILRLGLGGPAAEASIINKVIKPTMRLFEHGWAGQLVATWTTEILQGRELPSLGFFWHIVFLCSALPGSACKQSERISASRLLSCELSMLA